MITIVKELSIMLGLKNLTSYAKSEKISYQAARKRKVETLVIDNIKFENIDAVSPRNKKIIARIKVAKKEINASMVSR